MKVFNARAATEEYMSTHTLTFSTPEMTLKKFAMWLGEQVDVPGSKEGAMPRLVLYLEEKVSKSKASFLELMPDINEKFKPSGAVTKMYDFTEESTVAPKSTTSSVDNFNSENSKFCIGCGSKIKLNSKYCTKCGVNQE
ncbi:MAG: zinc ribbon domain-containing protein [Candidatus Nitrosopolaris sp.]